MLDVAEALWLERVRDVDDSVRAWSKTPPRGEATLLYHLGLIDSLPAVSPDDSSAPDDDIDEEVTFSSVADALAFYDRLHAEDQETSDDG